MTGILLFCTSITSRLRYIAGFFSKELLDEPIRITDDEQEFRNAAGPRINYSDKDFDPAVPAPGSASPAFPPTSAPNAGPPFTLRPTPLLFGSGIVPQDTACFDHNGRKVFFPTAGDLPFDIFAAAFFLISRYEEYLPHQKDVYGRFAHTSSLAYKEGFLNIPLVNYWLQDLKTALTSRYPDLVFRYPAFKFIPTYDIDLAYAYRYKGWKRNIGASVRSIVTGKWKEMGQRLRVLRGKAPDPFDAYEWLDSLHLYCRMRPYYFFLAAARCKGVDRNISTSGPGLQDLIRYHALGYRLGIHPSWYSGDDERLLKEELEWMEVIAEKDITRSRQHFIRFTLPHTYRRLLSHGIEQEFSMGYGTINGFRASVASSFYWYDLEREEQTTLRIFPFCFMDANAYYELHSTAAQAMVELMHYYHHVRRVGGLMVTIWHNTFLGTAPQFAGWREVYEVFLKEEVYWD
jgi:hypothetical protein